MAVLAQVPMVFYLALLPLGWKATPSWLLGLAALLVVGCLGRPQWHAAQEGSLTVVCWNVGVDVPHLEQAATALQKLDWDVALLQEAGLTPTHDVGQELLALMPVAHAVRGGYEGELLILSRRYPLRQPSQFLVDNLREELSVQADLGGRRLRLANVHLVRRNWHHETGWLESARMRDRQVRDVLAQGDFDLVGGDFNLPASTGPIDRLRDHYQDCFEVAGRGFGMSYPRPIPLWRIDYLFAARDLSVRDCRTVSLGASDHRAVVTRLALPDPVRTPALAPAPPPGPD